MVYKEKPRTWKPLACVCYATRETWPHLKGSLFLYVGLGSSVAHEIRVLSSRVHHHTLCLDIHRMPASVAVRDTDTVFLKAQLVRQL